MWSFLGSIGSSLLGGLFGSMSTDSTNSANARQAAAQRKWQTEENEKAYQRNRELAEQQNNLNVEQWQRERQAALEDWNRENAYNSPAAQMQRYRDAGLNPNLIYGQSNTSGGMASPSIAGSMTSGAPATPAAGVSPHPVIPKNFESMFSRIGDALMNIPIYKANVRKANAEATIAENEAAESDYDKAVKGFVRRLNFSQESLESLLNYGAGNESWAAEGSLYNNPDVRRYLFEYHQAWRGWKFNKDTYDSLVDKVLAEGRLADDEAQKVRDTLHSTIESINNHNSATIDWNKLEKIGMSPEVLMFLKVLADIAK